MLRDLQEVLSVKEHRHIVDIVLDYIYKILLAKVQTEVGAVDNMGHELELALHGEHEEELARVFGAVFLLFSLVVGQDDNDLSRGPVQFKHDLDEVHKADHAAVGRLSCAPSKEDFLHLGRAWVELAPKLDALLDETLLPVLEHASNHVPRDCHAFALDEVLRKVLIVFIDGDLKDK